MIYKISNYRHLVQKKDLCGPTCLQMVLFRRGVWIDQEELASILKTKVLFKVKQIYAHPLDFVEDEHPELGLNSENFVSNLVIEFLNQHNLRPELLIPNSADELKYFITDSLSKNQDVIVNVKMSAFDSNRKTGHYLLVNEINIGDDTVVLLDPNFDNNRNWKCSLNELFFSMGDHFDGKKRGLVLFRKLEGDV